MANQKKFENDHIIISKLSKSNMTFFLQGCLSWAIGNKPDFLIVDGHEIFGIIFLKKTHYFFIFTHQTPIHGRGLKSEVVRMRNSFGATITSVPGKTMSVYKTSIGYSIPKKISERRLTETNGSIFNVWCCLLKRWTTLKGFPHYRWFKRYCISVCRGVAFQE